MIRATLVIFSITLFGNSTALAQVRTQNVNGWKYTTESDVMTDDESFSVDRLSQAMEGNSVSFEVLCDGPDASPYATLFANNYAGNITGLLPSALRLRFDSNEPLEIPNFSGTIGPSLFSSLQERLKSSNQVAYDMTWSNAAEISICRLGVATDNVAAITSSIGLGYMGSQRDPDAVCGAVKSARVSGVINLAGSSAALGWMENRCGDYAPLPSEPDQTTEDSLQQESEQVDVGAVTGNVSSMRSEKLSVAEKKARDNN